LLFLGLLFAMILGCDQKAMVEKFADQADKDRALLLIDQLRSGKHAELLAMADPSIVDAKLAEVFQQMAALVPPGEPNSRELVGAHTHFQDANQAVNLTYQYRFDQQWLLINVATRAWNGKTTLIGMNVQPLQASLQEMHGFSLGGKSGTHFLFFAIAILNVLLVFTAVVLVYRHSNMKRKWAWYLFVLVGLGQFTINWTTGAWTFTPLSILLFSSAALAYPFGAWMISIAVPVGALMVILGRLLPPAATEEPQSVTDTFPPKP
jgi:hypothetical protein